MEEEFGFIANNGDGMDLVHNSYILSFLRTNKDMTHNYKCRHRVANEPCPGSTTLNETRTVIVRSVREHNHPPLSHVGLVSRKYMIKEKELAATTNQPLSQIHTKIQGELVKELTRDIERTNIADIDACLDEVAQIHPDFLSVKSGLKKKRLQNQPTLPI
jgi:hypothetical protein